MQIGDRWAFGARTAEPPDAGEGDPAAKAGGTVSALSSPPPPRGAASVPPLCRVSVSAGSRSPESRCSFLNVRTWAPGPGLLWVEPRGRSTGSRLMAGLSWFGADAVQSLGPCVDGAGPQLPAATGHLKRGLCDLGMDS